MCVQCAWFLFLFIFVGSLFSLNFTSLSKKRKETTTRERERERETTTNERRPKKCSIEFISWCSGVPLLKKNHAMLCAAVIFLYSALKSRRHYNSQKPTTTNNSERMRKKNWITITLWSHCDRNYFTWRLRAGKFRLRERERKGVWQTHERAPARVLQIAYLRRTCTHSRKKKI